LITQAITEGRESQPDERGMLDEFEDAYFDD